MRSRFHHAARTAALVLAFASPLLARGRFWDFLGYAQVDAAHDHGRIPITRHDRLFRTIQFRVSEEAIFLDRVVVHFGNGASQEIIVSERISPGGKDYVVDLPGEHRALESVEIWYYKETWGHNPTVNLYGVRLPEVDGEATAPEP